MEVRASVVGSDGAFAVRRQRHAPAAARPVGADQKISVSEPADEQRHPASGPTGLVGREAQLALLSETLEDGGGRPAVVEVIGEPGIGKTRLLREFAIRAKIVAGVVLSIVAAPDDTFDKMMEPLLRLVPATTQAVHGPASIAEHLAQALRSQSAADHPAVLLIDDVHLADPGSLQPIGELLQSVQDVLVVLAYRPRQADHRLPATLARVAGVRREMLQLPGLTADEACRLLGVPPSPRAAAAHELAHGNPLYTHAYGDLVRSGRNVVTDDLAGALPATVAQQLDIELMALTDDERSVLRSAAVLDDGCDPALVADVAGLDRQRTAELVDALVARDLLRPDFAAGPGLRFRHPVVRAAVYRTIEPSQTRRMHTSAANLLRGLGYAPVRYADHLARSALPGDLDAARTVLAAVRDRRVGPVTSASWLSKIRRLLADRVEPGLSFAIEVELVTALVAAGRLDEGRTLLDQLAGRPAGTADERAQIVLARAGVDLLQGRPREALAQVRQELRDDQSTPLRTRLATEAAVSAVLCGSPAAAHYAALAGRLSVDDESPLLAARTHWVQALVAGVVGDIPALTEHAGPATEIIDQLPDAALVGALDLFQLAGTVESLREREREAVRHFDRGLRLAGSSRLSPLVPYLLVGRARATRRLGHLEQSFRNATEAEERAVELRFEVLAALARTSRSEAICWLTGPAAARAVLGLATVDPTAGERDSLREIGDRTAARLRHQAGEGTDAFAALLRSSGGEALRWTTGCARPYWAAILADMARTSGDLAAAGHWIQEAERHAQRLGLAGQRAHVQRARADLALAAGIPGAVEHAAAAVDAFAGLGWPLDEAAARTVYAAALGTLERWREAETELGAVRRIADLTGARALLQSVVGEQRRLAGRAGRTATGGQAIQQPSSLTRREWDIVKLVTAGVSNNEVADRLFVTVKTVEAHLTRIFRKLGVTSRVGLVVALSDPRFAPPRD